MIPVRWRLVTFLGRGDRPGWSSLSRRCEDESVTGRRLLRISRRRRDTSAPTNERKIRVLIVDDEPAARERIRDLLAGQPDAEVAGECGDGREAVEVIEQGRFELVFLDIQMPGMDGFAVVDAVGIDRMPPVVLMSSCDQHAVRSFEVCALDYLLKPVDRERFERVLDRARAQICFGPPGTWSRRLLSLLERVRPNGTSSDRLVIRSGGRLFLLPSEEVDWIGAEGNYARIHAGKQAHLVRETLTDLERRLDGWRFLRIHKSTIVNADRIREIQPTVNGAHLVLLRDGSRLTWSRGYRSRLKDLIGEDD